MKKAIVTGMIATYPVGGVVWDYGQYALGLEELGYEVHYLEDTGWECYHPQRGEYGADCAYGVDFLARSLTQLSPALGRRWHFRNMDGATYGLTPEAFREVLRSADLFLNVSGGSLLRDEYMHVPHKVLIDSDPGWNHFRNYPRWDANPNWYGSHGYRAHDHFFTYAERMGRPDCSLPNLGIEWNPTRPPVVLNRWQPRPPATHWTTVMTWKNFQEPIVHEGVTYGTKEMEFGRVEELPRYVPARLEIALGGSKAPVDAWRGIGWSVRDAASVSQTADAYRDYIETSRGEFSVAKNVYVATRCGWFSCRSVCYLAAARPVVVQDTGFSEFLPAGEGLLSFTTLDEAVEAVRRVESDYARHQQAALDVARRYFDARVVLRDLLKTIGLPS